MVGPPPSRSREQLRAAAVLGALVLLSVGVWAFAVLTTGSDTPERDPFAGLEPDPEAPDAGAPDAGAPSPDASDPPESDPDADGDAAGGDPASEDDAAGGDPAADEDDGDDPSTERVDFDGACVVDVEGDVPPEELRPWRFEECERAPIALEGTQQRWVAIVESLSGDDFSEAEALERIEEDEERVLLWSSHYPSLNPGLWVIVEGPFESQVAATDAAQRLGGGAYPRALTDDEGDRYCVAADGCVGETRP